MSGRNWGDAVIDGSTLVFNVAGKPAFRIPLSDVAQVPCSLPLSLLSSNHMYCLFMAFSVCTAYYWPPVEIANLQPETASCLRLLSGYTGFLNDLSVMWSKILVATTAGIAICRCRRAEMMSCWSSLLMTQREAIMKMPSARCHFMSPRRATDLEGKRLYQQQR